MEENGAVRFPRIITPIDAHVHARRAIKDGNYNSDVGEGARGGRQGPREKNEQLNWSDWAPI